MSDVYERMLDLFKKFLRGDAALRERINSYDGKLAIERDGIEFTLPALAGFLCSGADADYKSFRKSVFANATNQKLKQWNGEVVLHRANGKVDKNEYRLQKMTPTCLTNPPT